MLLEVHLHKIDGKVIAYHNIQKDKNGWIDATIYAPPKFDLVYLKLSTNRKAIGWWTGHEWIGRTLAPSDKVDRWRKSKELNPDDVSSSSKYSSNDKLKGLSNYWT